MLMYSLITVNIFYRAESLNKSKNVGFCFFPSTVSITHTINCLWCHDPMHTLYPFIHSLCCPPPQFTWQIYGPCNVDVLRSTFSVLGRCRREPAFHHITKSEFDHLQTALNTRINLRCSDDQFVQ